MEIWKPIPGYEDTYEVSSQGRVRSIDRFVHFTDGRKRFFKGVVRAVYFDDFGYPKTTLKKQGKNERVHIHVLVALAFIGPRPDGLQVCHNDGNPKNCRKGNLRYDTPTGNHADKIKHGTHLQGERAGNAKLTESVIRRIRELRGRYTGRQLAKMFGTSPAHVCNIQKGVRWGHL